MKILPPGMSFQQAVVMGYTGRILFEQYLAWLRTLPCDTCGAPPPSEASHINSVKGMGTKAPDPFSIPECHSCNRNYDRAAPEVDNRLQRAIWYLLRAIWERRLVWSTKAANTVEVPRYFLEDFLKAVDFHDGHGTPSIDRARAEILYAEAKKFLA